jgi:PhzF family phenazine biosynthesis protein
VQIYIVDAFTDTAYKGNPAAVCLLDSIPSDEWMQNVASEMNLSETAFLYQEDEAYNLRWFTPVSEVDLCGHATLASAHILWEEGFCKTAGIIFKTKSGVLKAFKSDQWIHLNFPVVIAAECSAPAALVDGLGVNLTYIGRNRMDYIVEVDDEDAVRELKPDFTRLKELDARGVIVTSISNDPAYDFVSRCFYPAIGVNEDPVTGSAHCCLGPYWMNKLNKSRLNAIQLSARQGKLMLEVGHERIIISGQAVTTLRGHLI